MRPRTHNSGYVTNRQCRAPKAVRVLITIVCFPCGGGWAAWSLCSLPCRLVLLTQDSRPTATKPSDTNTKRLTGFAMIVFFASSKNSYNSDEIMSPVKYYGGRNYNCVNRDKPYVLDSTDLRQFVTWLCPTSKVPHLALNTYQTWNTQDV